MTETADTSNSSPQKPDNGQRRIACIRCRRRKKRCDHALPACGECKKANLQCIQSGVARRGHSVTVPLAYLRQLEEGISKFPSNDQPAQGNADNGEQRGQSDFGRTSTHDLPQVSSPADGEIETAYPSPIDEIRTSDGRHSSARSLFLDDLTDTPPRIERGAAYEASPGSRLFTDNHTGEPPPSDWAEHYASVYFQIVHPQWQFMDETTWTNSFLTWLEDSTQLPRAERFLVQVTLATGALVCSSFRSRCPHLHHSQNLYRNALRYDLDEVTTSPSLLFRTQASLLLLTYALHDSTPDLMEQHLSLALMNCVSLMAEPPRPTTEHEDSHSLHLKNIRDRVIMSCHILNEVASSGWTYPSSVMRDIIDDKILQYAMQIQTSKCDPSIFDQLFRLRCIQAKIRRDNKKLRHLDPDDPLRQICYTRLKGELELWKSDTSTVTDASSRNAPIFHAPFNVLYDYTMAILMQDKPLAIVVENIHQLVRCCSDACCAFVASQEENQAAFLTWGALMYQFRLGVLILYCCWITPSAAQEAGFPLQEAICGVRDCRRTLRKFSKRWPTSKPFLTTFEAIAETIMDGPSFGLGSQGSNLVDYQTDLSTSSALYTSEAERLATMTDSLTDLRLQKVHTAVISLIEEMVHGLRSRGEMSQLQLAPALYNCSLDLFNF